MLTAAAICIGQVPSRLSLADIFPFLRPTGGALAMRQLRHSPREYVPISGGCGGARRLVLSVCSLSAPALPRPSPRPVTGREFFVKSREPCRKLPREIFPRAPSALSLNRYLSLGREPSNLITHSRDDSPQSSRPARQRSDSLILTVGV